MVIVAITNVPLLDFCGGIFLGSLKPYLLDSYLGYFGKSLVDGSASQSGWEDALLLAALGASVIIGVFASQLAGETWDSVLEEVEAEKANAKEEEEKEPEGKRQFLGFDLPDWVVSFQDNMDKADNRVNTMVLDEYNAKLWNATGIVTEPNPSFYPDSPEVVGRNKGIDIGSDICDGLMLSPVLFSAFIKYGDPLYEEKDDLALQERALEREIQTSPELQERESLRQSLLVQADKLRVRTEERIAEIERRM